ncbi:kinesin-like protein KIN-14C [Dendrobium catenatum]|uniref:kinesin-like protein KIN-14C n=1 Tax=Dendrobium catenatum TaxID=906689 RepID=UPI00109EF98B|nr:kinesin-like protein KIN-14C [Dendrobium catenatum]
MSKFEEEANLNLEGEDCESDGIGSMSAADASGKRRRVVEWLNSLFPSLNIPLEASDEELRALLFDGTVLCGVEKRQDPSAMENQRGAYISFEQRREKVRRFLSAVEGMGLPSFTVDDLENGSISAVLDCLLSLRDHFNSKLGEGDIHGTANCGNKTRKKWFTSKDDRGAMDVCEGNLVRSGKNSPTGEEENKNKYSESIFHRVWHSSAVPVFHSVEQTASLRHGGHKFHEVFQLKHGRYSDIPAAKISEIIKSNGLDNAPTQSLLSVINRILDESIDRKNGEMPLRVASLLRKVVQEIERRISTQTEHIRNQNDLIKAREEKYQSRIRVLETLAAGTNEEVQVKKTAIESKKQEEQQTLKLMKEKENNDRMILEFKQELEAINNTYEDHYQQLDAKAKQNEARLQERTKEAEFLLAESSKRMNELKAFSEFKFHNWTKKENVFHNFISFQLQSLKGLRTSSESIKVEVNNSQRQWTEELNSMGFRLKVLLDAAENYQTILAENRKLYNEVQELKGNIRVYCRLRPFLPSQFAKSTVDYIGDNGELGLVNPSRQGKDGHRVFKFNKVFGQTATQVQVFLDIQPLIRSVLDGYNVCIFAYGQTGSGKTYTMSGPDSPSEEEWGVNYRALNDLFQISQARRNAYNYEVRVQMVEIYNEQIRDLLSDSGSQKRLGILNSSQPDGSAVPDARMVPVKSSNDVLAKMKLGQANRAVGSTALNERSSRSHCILTVHVRGEDLKTGSTSRACLHLIDLAGSERVDRSEVTGERLKEAQYINKSLSALGDVIFALSQKSAHVPYRNSKLTQILQSSLGGQAKTLMLVQINPDGDSYSETLSTLKFAERVSGVELGSARCNKEGKDVKDLIEQVASLKDTIARKDNEIEQLQRLKDRRVHSPKSNSLRQSSSSGVSSSGGVTQQGGGKVAKFIEKDVLDAENFSEFSSQNSDVGSQLSMCDGGNADEGYHVDKETGDYGDEVSDGQMSDVSAGDLSLGKESVYSVGSNIESAIHPMAAKPSEVPTEM